MTTMRESTLDYAKECVCGDREQSYGNPENNFGMIGKLWSDYLGIEISAVDVSMMMVLFKAARVKTGTAKLDSFIDIAGYAACGCEIAMSKESEDGWIPCEDRPPDETGLYWVKASCGVMRKWYSTVNGWERMEGMPTAWMPLSESV